MMKRYIILTMLALFIVPMATSLYPRHLEAAFDPNRIIDDGVFNNTVSMSAGDIDAMLNARSSCISPNSGFRAPDPIGYAPSTGYKYGGNVTAGTVIAHAAQAYDLNPQVLLATLQKEQSLVTRTSCTTNTIAKALGYGCPDSGGSYNYSGVNLYTRHGTTYTSVEGICVNSALKAGFSQQVIRATWLLKFAQQRSLGNIDWAIIRGNWDNSDDLQSCYSGPVTQGYRKVCPSGATVYYDGLRTIDNTTVQMTTGATAALYWYTPHLHGNQNFVTIFESWFGSTQSPDYSWQVLNQAIYTSSAKTHKLGWNATFIGEDTAHAVLLVKNTGNQTWTKTTNPVRLATWGPQDRNSNFCTSGWINCNRVATFNETTVAPGETATFEFPIKAPTTGGLYTEYFNLVAEGKSWFRTAGQYFTFDVKRQNFAWSHVNQAVYTDQTKSTKLGWNANVTAGQKVYVSVKAKNMGNVTWFRSGDRPIYMATWNPQDRTSEFCSGWARCNRAALQTEPSVSPGGTATFEFWMQVPPNRSGDLRQYFNLVAEGKTWMNDTGMYIGLNTRPLSYTWQPVSQAVYTNSAKTTKIGWHATLSPNQTAFAVVKAKNTGNVAWVKNDPASPSIRIGTWNPQDRQSPLCQSWISCTRPTVQTESVVQPGETATFEFPIKAPSQPGSYNEYFNLVAEMRTWMNSTGMFINVTVN